MINNFVSTFSWVISIRRIDKTVSFSTKHPIVDVETYNNLGSYGINPWPYHLGEIGIAGFFVDNKITQFLLKDKNNIEKIREGISDHLSTLSGKPLYAFNIRMEIGCFNNLLGRSPQFLEAMPFHGRGASKEYFFAFLLKHDKVTFDSREFIDPLNGDGVACIDALNKGQYQDALDHNHCCLTKEATILEYKNFIRKKHNHLVDETGWLIRGKTLPSL